MALTDDQRGPRAAWLRRNRVALYGSGDGGLAKLAAALRGKGLDRSPTTIKGWEASDDRSPIPPDVLPVLEDLFSERAPRAIAPVATAELIGALRDQTAAIGNLVSAMAGSRVVDAPAPYIHDVDARTLKARRAYWIARALDETRPRITRPRLRVAVGLPAGRETTLARWVAGDIPTGPELERFAHALMLPLRILQDPPETDHERLVEWRREAIAELPAAEVEIPERKRRSA